VAAARGTGPSILRLGRMMQGGRTLLTVPLLLFLGFVFLYPIGSMLLRSFKVDAVVDTLPGVTGALAGGAEVPSDAIFLLLAIDLRAADSTAVATAGSTLNYFEPRLRSLLIASAKVVRDLPPEEAAKRLAEDGRWHRPEVWDALRELSHRYTPAYYRRVADLSWEDGQPKPGIYSLIYVRSFWMALVVTASAVGIGYPLAYMISKQPARRAALMVFLVMVPFWTSLLARTASWLIIFQKDGPLNTLLLALGAVDAPLELLFTRGAVYAAMIHVMIPFVTLPVHATMRGIPPEQMRAATSLGAHPYEAFWRVYVPQTLPAVGASALLVFTMTLGLYVVPLLLGGAGDQMISYNIASHTLQTGNWGIAAALASGLLVMTLAICGLYGALAARRSLRMVRG